MYLYKYFLHLGGAKMEKTRLSIKMNWENLNSLVTLIILGVQVILLVLLTIKIDRLEQAFISITNGSVPPAPVIVERTPDERG
jgi:hypothetical protein